MDLKERLKELDKHATFGVWGQFSPSAGPFKEQASDYFRNREWSHMDSSHHMSAITPEGPKRLSEWKHADDAAFAEALVNAYREGKLEVKDG